MVDSPSGSTRRFARKRPLRWLTWFAGAGLLLALAPAQALAGASSGELFFYPCTNCHPVHMVPGPTAGTLQPSRPLPNGFTGHSIALVGHDKLGTGAAACLTCHDDPTRNPGMLKTADGSLIDIKSPDIALVCYRCHESKYKDWKAGTHGKHKPSCMAAGCHDPHSPQFIYAGPLMPFTGAGWQFQVLPQRVAFKPLAPPAPDPATAIPSWFSAFAALGFVVAAGLVGTLVQGRSKR